MPWYWWSFVAVIVHLLLLAGVVILTKLLNLFFHRRLNLDWSDFQVHRSSFSKPFSTSAARAARLWVLDLSEMIDEPSMYIISAAITFELVVLGAWGLARRLLVVLVVQLVLLFVLILILRFHLVLMLRVVVLLVIDDVFYMPPRRHTNEL